MTPRERELQTLARLKAEAERAEARIADGKGGPDDAETVKSARVIADLMGFPPNEKDWPDDAHTS